MTDILNSLQLIELAEKFQKSGSCEICSQLNCPGWESMPSSFDRSNLKKIGTLRSTESEPSLDEFHPNKTNLWSVKAPIAINFYPYNLCDLYQCTGCSQLFLRYTEYGGYYEEERIRIVNPDLVT